MRIYTYANEVVNIELPEASEMIHVKVLTGDEIVTVVFKDGMNATYDSSLLIEEPNPRKMDFYDGDYIVTGDKLKAWMDYRPSGGVTASYDRMSKFI